MVGNNGDLGPCPQGSLRGCPKMRHVGVYAVGEATVLWPRLRSLLGVPSFSERPVDLEKETKGVLLGRGWGGCAQGAAHPRTGSAGTCSCCECGEFRFCL